MPKSPRTPDRAMKPRTPARARTPDVAPPSAAPRKKKLAPDAARMNAGPAATPNAATTRAATTQAPVAAAAPTKPAKGAKVTKSRTRTIRDSFNMPRDDFALLARLKDVAREAGRPAKKSELIRAGLHVLATLPGAQLCAALEGLPPVAKGRPTKAA